MSLTLEVVFDGTVFRPRNPPDLKPNTRYVISIQETVPEPPVANAWDTLERLAGTVEAPEDWAMEHDRYLYGRSPAADESQDPKD